MEEPNLELVNQEIAEGVGPGKNFRQFDINVAHNPTRDVWTVAIGIRKHEAPSLADALHDMANELDAVGAYGSDKDRTNLYIERHSKPCVYCGALIFFGQLESKKWLPLDAEPVYAAQALGARLATFVDYQGQHMIRFPSKPQGRLWVPHPTVCGSNNNPPIQEFLLKRWQERRDLAHTKVTEEKSKAVSILRKIAHDLGEEPNGIRRPAA